MAGFNLPSACQPPAYNQERGFNRIRCEAVSSNEHNLGNQSKGTSVNSPQSRDQQRTRTVPTVPELGRDSFLNTGDATETVKVSDFYSRSLVCEGHGIIGTASISLERNRNNY